jgi:hypothetical protein
VVEKAAGWVVSETRLPAWPARLLLKALVVEVEDDGPVDSLSEAAEPGCVYL